MPGYKEDEGKTVLRMEKQEMERLGIKSGDVVMVSANKTTAAICLATDAKYQTSNESKIEYLNKQEIIYPVVRLSNNAFQNAGIIYGMGSFVRITKISSKVMDASKVILSTPKEAKTIYGSDDYQKRIDLTKYLDNIISKGDMVNFLVDPVKRMNFFSTILDVKPSNDKQVWKIVHDTKFELKEVANPNVYLTPTDSSRLTDLVRVVPIVQKIQIDQDLNLTVPFLEIYNNGAKIFFYLTERIHKIETLNVNGMEMRRPFQKLDGLPFANIEISDDKGNSYSYGRSEGHGSGGSTFPSNAPDWEYYSKHTISLAFWPPIARDVNELTISVKEFFWQKHPFPLPFPRNPQNRLEKGRSETKETKIEEFDQKMRPPQMHPVEQRGLAVLSGPWEFRVHLN